MKKIEIEKQLLDDIISNFDINSKTWDLYSKEEIINWIKLFY